MRFIESDIDRLRSLVREPLRCEAAPKLKQIDIRDAKHTEEIFVTHGWLSGPVPKLNPTYDAITQKYIAKEKRIGNPTRLILVDEADRLKIVSLEQMRAIFDAGGIGLVLMKFQAKELKTIRALLKTSEISVQEVARRLGVSRSTLYRNKLT